MEKGGIVVERMMAGALRADGQRRMIGDTVTETKLPKRCSGATRELTQFTWPASFRPPTPVVQTPDPYSFYLHQPAPRSSCSSKRAAYLLSSNSGRRPFDATFIQSRCHGSSLKNVI